MHVIDITVTASRTYVDNKFKGTVTFKNENGDEVSYNYLITDPDNSDVDLEYSNNKDSFQVKGTPSKELIEALKENQRWVFGLSINLLSRTIDNSQSMLLSQGTTDMMRVFGADASGQMSSQIQIDDENGYQLVFGEEITENQKLAKETGIPVRLIQKAKYSSLSDYGNCTLEEAEDAYEKAPDEGKEVGDKTLLKIIKKVVELRSQVPA